MSKLDLLLFRSLKIMMLSVMFWLSYILYTITHSLVFGGVAIVLLLIAIAYLASIVLDAYLNHKRKQMNIKQAKINKELEQFDIEQDERMRMEFEQLLKHRSN